MAEVALENVTKIYPGNVKAVADMSLSIADKEFVVLVGPSGCGKSTTLRMVAGLEEVTGGTISIGGRVVNEVAPKDRDIAMVFQNYALYPHMTVYDNMAFGLKLRGFPKDEIQARVKEATQILGIEELLDRKPKALSGGQRQRVAVGRAIVRKPSVFLFDEPLSNLDAKLRVEMRAELNKLHTRLGTTMIYVTHDQVEAMTLGDRIVIMDNGVISQVGSPLEIYDNPVNKFVGSFIGTPAMNFMLGRVEGSGEASTWTDGDSRVTLRSGLALKASEYSGKEVSLGVRPEDLAFGNGDGEIRARVEVVEPLGNEMILYLATEKQSFVARADAHQQVSVGDNLSVTVSPSKAHLFDEATGRNLMSNGSADQAVPAAGAADESL